MLISITRNTSIHQNYVIAKNTTSQLIKTSIISTSKDGVISENFPIIKRDIGPNLNATQKIYLYVS